MTRRTNTIPPDYFDGLYAADPDPWRFATSAYEREKYDATLRALARPRYGRALEVGCSIGVFTRELARRCGAVLAIDASAVALEAARTACANVPNVSFAERVIPGAFPDGPFDLIVLSEVLYYLDEDDLRRSAARCDATLAAGGEIVTCHWLGETDYPLTGARASTLFAEAVVTRRLAHAVLHADVYRLDRLWRG